MPPWELLLVKLHPRKFIADYGRGYRQVVRWSSTSTTSVLSDLATVANGLGPDWSTRWPKISSRKSSPTWLRVSQSASLAECRVPPVIAQGVSPRLRVPLQPSPLPRLSLSPLGCRAGRTNASISPPGTYGRSARPTVPPVVAAARPPARSWHGSTDCLIST